MAPVMRIKANGITLHCRIDGQVGAPWLVFSNSLATDLTMWDEQTDYLGRFFRILRYDQRGHGQSEAPPGRYSFDTLIADAVGLLDALDIGRVNFCGLSMGGSTAIGLVQRHPERLDRVIVCSSPCLSTPAAAKDWEARIAIAEHDGMAPLVEPTIARWFPPDIVAAQPPHLVKIREMILATSVDGFIGCAAALAYHDFRPGVAAVTRPVLFVVGEKDGALPGMRQMHAELAGSALAELSGAGHICNLDRSDLFNRAVEEFLHRQ